MRLVPLVSSFKVKHPSSPFGCGNARRYLVHFNPDRHAFALAPVAFAPVHAPVFIINTASKEKQSDEKKSTFPPQTTITRRYRRLIFSPHFLTGVFSTRESMFQNLSPKLSEFCTARRCQVSSGRRLPKVGLSRPERLEGMKLMSKPVFFILQQDSGIVWRLFLAYVAARRTVPRVGSSASCQIPSPVVQCLVSRTQTVVYRSP